MLINQKRDEIYMKTVKFESQKFSKIPLSFYPFRTEKSKFIVYESNS